MMEISEDAYLTDAERRKFAAWCRLQGNWAALQVRKHQSMAKGIDPVTRALKLKAASCMEVAEMLEKDETFTPPKEEL